ncbi:MAG TPA: putative molybdenum carrier protein [Vicinamibacterales bacterium]
MRLTKIISGAQSGVDLAALAFALDHGYDIGGACPFNYANEDGQIPERFRPYLECTPTVNYPARTRLNVKRADATLLLWRGRKMTPGTALTFRIMRERAEQCRYPYLSIQAPFGDVAAAQIHDWLRDPKIRVLNVAGPRESKAPGIYSEVYELLARALPARVREEAN